MRFKFLLGLMLVVLSVSSYAGCVEPSGDYIQIFNAIKAQLPVEYSKLIVRIQNTDPGNAYSSPDGTVNLSKEFIGGDKELLALTIGHELGHQILGHMVDFHNSKLEERDADGVGLMLYLKMNYCNPKGVIQKDYLYAIAWYKKNHIKVSSTHGTAKSRRDRMLNQLKYLEDLNKGVKNK